MSNNSDCESVAFEEPEVLEYFEYDKKAIMLENNKIKSKIKKSKKSQENESRISQEDRLKISELLQILQELQICTDILQGDGVTVSKILPSIMTVIHKVDLNNQHNLLMFKDKKIYFEDLSLELIASIKNRLR
ncbi:unnamed protein product [Brachionus calyciflorus]|uniref:Uncharacterized protein n=1 Tax=Brachionus calyciflorus TaxID=104777 RepID=A0A814JK70_9BILA|nr:unnamed protein product [Brachionus calyciflorus]